MKILIAPDKFKGSLSGKEICSITKEVFSEFIDPDSIESLPLADGGDGTIEALLASKNLQEISLEVHDPLFRKIKASYFTEGETAWIELANASGYVRLHSDERNPMFTSSYGTGELMLHAINNNCKEIILLLGGSSTNDAGMGILNALGMKFYNEDRTLLQPIGKNLLEIRHADNSNLLIPENIKIKILTDVKNPMFGLNGAAYVYGKQKGASPLEIEMLNKGLKHFAEFIEKNNNVDVSKIVGGGSAGGIAAGLSGFMDVTIKNGFQEIASILKLENKIETADIIISGEGSLDNQSLEGKVVSGVGAFAQKYSKPLYIISGRNLLSQNDTQQLGVTQVYSVMDIAKSEEDAINNADIYLKTIARKIIKALL